MITWFLSSFSWNHIFYHKKNYPVNKNNAQFFIFSQILFFNQIMASMILKTVIIKVMTITIFSFLKMENDFKH